jgi:hypothetical protein
VPEGNDFLPPSVKLVGNSTWGDFATWGKSAGGVVFALPELLLLAATRPLASNLPAHRLDNSNTRHLSARKQTLFDEKMPRRAEKTQHTISAQSFQTFYADAR